MYCLVLWLWSYPEADAEETGTINDAPLGPTAKRLSPKTTIVHRQITPPGTNSRSH
jgi:hypothetical protein